MLSKEVSSTVLKVFGMTQPGIEPRSPEPLANKDPPQKCVYSPNLSARAGFDTRSIFKRSLSGVNSEFSFS